MEVPMLMEVLPEGQFPLAGPHWWKFPLLGVPPLVEVCTDGIPWLQVGTAGGSHSWKFLQ